MTSESDPGPRAPRAALFDALIALFLLGVSLSILFSLADRHEIDGFAAAAALLIVHSGVLALRRRAPTATWGASLVAAVGVVALGLPLVTLGVAMLVAVYTVASMCPRTKSVPVLMVTTAAMAAAIGIRETGGDPTTIAGNIVVFAVVWFLGDSQRERRVYVSRLEERTAELERARDELARRAAAEERLRIARELHDVVAHSMGMIAVQAGVGAHVIDTQPEEAKRSLQTIEQASKATLSEIRRMLGLLRSSDELAETEPSPGLAGLSSLVEEVRSTGLDVKLDVDASQQVPDAVQLTIYRIVQEALTNVVKHASASRARVCVRLVDDEARIEIIDDGASAAAPGSGGHGIAGMRERAALHGGRLEAGPLAEGGFRVFAQIPVQDRAP